MASGAGITHSDRSRKQESNNQSSRVKRRVPITVADVGDGDRSSPRDQKKRQRTDPTSSDSDGAQGQQPREESRQQVRKPRPKSGKKANIFKKQKRNATSQQPPASSRGRNVD